MSSCVPFSVGAGAFFVEAEVFLVEVAIAVDFAARAVFERVTAR